MAETRKGTRTLLPATKKKGMARQPTGTMECRILKWKNQQKLARVGVARGKRGDRKNRGDKRKPGKGIIASTNLKKQLKKKKNPHEYNVRSGRGESRPC